MQKVMVNSITAYEQHSAEFAVRAYSISEKRKLLAYMQSFTPYAAAGRITDCVTGERLRTEDVGYTDGTFMWTSQDMDHIDKYNAAVTNAFLKRVMN